MNQNCCAVFQFLFEAFYQCSIETRVRKRRRAYSSTQEKGKRRQSQSTTANTSTELQNSSNQMRVFGEDLSCLMDRETETSNIDVPVFIDLCLKRVQENAHVEGLFRIPGNNKDIDRIIRDLQTDKFQPSDLDRLSIHTIASLLKRYLRELPDPLVPKSMYYDWIALTQIKTTTEEEMKEKQRALGHLYIRLPLYHRTLLMRLLTLLHCISTSPNLETSKMNASNLSFVFGQNILRSPNDTSDFIINTEFTRMNAVVFLLLKEFNYLERIAEEGALHFSHITLSATYSRNTKSLNCVASPATEYLDEEVIIIENPTHHLSL